jgi:hypothetical protein
VKLLSDMLILLLAALIVVGLVGGICYRWGYAEATPKIPKPPEHQAVLFGIGGIVCKVYQVVPVSERVRGQGEGSMRAVLGSDKFEAGWYAVDCKSW